MKSVGATDYLGKNVSIVIDRKLGTKHPKHGFIYMVNYGYSTCFYHCLFKTDAFSKPMF